MMDSGKLLESEKWVKWGWEQYEQVHVRHLNNVVSSIARLDKCNIAKYKYMLLNMHVKLNE